MAANLKRLRLFSYRLFSIFALGLIAYYLVSSNEIVYHMVEICDNAVDDDMDGLIDLNDPDCECEVTEPISLIPNPSFEDMECCPFEMSQLDCASVWIQASEPTTDYIHICDWLGWPDFPPPFPFPDGQGIMGFRDGRVRSNNVPETNWKEYAGACLINPLEKDSTYRIEFDLGFVSAQKSPPINITFYGSTDCDNLPFGLGNAAFGCPTNGPGWVALGDRLISGGSGNKWVKSFIEVTPSQDIQAIAIGPDCPAVYSDISIYYFFDNLILADFKFFELGVSEVNHPCQDNFSLRVPANESFQFQWYKDGIALIGETDNQLSTHYGEGDYSVVIDNGESCRVSAKYDHQIPVLSNPITRVICEDEVYEFGDNVLTQPGEYQDTFASFYNCDSIVTLNLIILGSLSDTVNARIFEGETFTYEGKDFKKEGSFEVVLESSRGCDSLVLLNLEFFKVYFPNVFSPNSDGINDIFQVEGAPELITGKELIIFDRWGSKIFEGESWDGKYKGSYVSPGLYGYVIDVRMNDGVIRQFYGSVTVIR